MRWKRTIQMVDVHCEGEIGRVAVGGVPKIPGNSIAEQLAHLNTVDDSLRRFLCLEPRSGSLGSVNLLVPPKRPEADAGFIILQADQAHAMSGSNAICVTTALLETGMIEMQEPETVVMLDTASGLVKATARCRDGRCESVELTMTPSFVLELDAALETEDWGTIHLDVCYGGIFYALVDAEAVGLKIEKAQARQLVEAGMKIKALINAAMPVVHPEIPEITGVAYVMFRGMDDGRRGADLHHDVAGPGRPVALRHRQFRQSGDPACPWIGQGRRCADLAFDDWFAIQGIAEGSHAGCGQGRRHRHDRRAGLDLRPDPDGA